MGRESDRLCPTRAAESCLRARIVPFWDEDFCLQIKLEEALEGSSDLSSPLFIQRMWLTRTNSRFSKNVPEGLIQFQFAIKPLAEILKAVKSQSHCPLISPDTDMPCLGMGVEGKLQLEVWQLLQPFNDGCRTTCFSSESQTKLVRYLNQVWGGRRWWCSQEALCVVFLS